MERGKSRINPVVFDWKWRNQCEQSDSWLYVDIDVGIEIGINVCTDTCESAGIDTQTDEF